MIKSEDKAAFIIFMVWIFLLTSFVILIGYNGLYGMDSHEYLRYCNLILDWIKTGSVPGNFFWPVNYPFLGACLAFITGPQPALQLLSIVSSAWILYLLFMLLIREFPGREKETILYVLIFLGASPFFFRYSISVMTDINALAFTCTAFYLIYLYTKCENYYALYVAPLFISLAVFTRFAMVPLLFPVAVFLCYLLIKSFRPVFFFISMLVALVPAFLYFSLKGNAYGEIFHHAWVSDWSLMNFFSNSFQTIDGYSHYVLPNVIYVFSFLVHPGYVFTGTLFLMVLFFKKNKPMLMWPLLIASMLGYIFFLAGMPSRNDRFLIALLPFYLVICFPSFLSILAYFHTRKISAGIIISVVCIIQFAFLYRAFIPFLNMNRLEKTLSEKIRELNPHVLYTFGMEGALRSYGYKGDIVTLWPDSIKKAPEGSVILFNRSANEVQWKNQAPMINFNLLKDSAGAVLIEKVYNGWEIYETKKAYPAADSGFPLR